MSERRWYRTRECSDGEPGCIDSDLLSDAEVLAELGAVRIWDTCQDCDGGKQSSYLGSGPVEDWDCPSCGGSGRTPKDGVEFVERRYTESYFKVPASMVEEADRD